MTQFALAWSMDGADGLQRITLPWRSIGAVRDTKTGLGWWWPRDLHPAARASFQAHAELWQPTPESATLSTLRSAFPQIHGLLLITRDCWFQAGCSAVLNGPAMASTTRASSSTSGAGARQRKASTHPR